MGRGSRRWGRELPPAHSTGARTGVPARYPSFPTSANAIGDNLVMTPIGDNLVMTSSESPSPWFAAVELGARGRYGSALAALERLQESPRWNSLALSTIGSLRRQIGAPSLAHDLKALEHASDDEAESDALVGIAADSVAEGDAFAALAMLSEAYDTAVAGGWRTLTRWHWVSAEALLLAEDATGAREHARLAQESCAQYSRRHAIKSLIIAMAARDPAALARMDEAHRAIQELDLATLAWPLALVVDDVLLDHPENSWSRGQVAAIQSAGRGAVRMIAAELPDSLLPSWTAHPGAARLAATDAAPRRSEGPVA